MYKRVILCLIVCFLNMPAYGESDPERSFYDAGADFIPNDVISWKDDPFLRGYNLDRFATYREFISFMRSIDGHARMSDIPADDWDTSLYMIGTVSVSVILPESIGGTEDWTEEEIAQVHQEIENGIRWWAEQELGAHLNFVFNYEDSVLIVDEPITQNGSGFWTLHTMSALGYGWENYGDMSYWLQAMYDYVNNQRNLKNADWGFVVFVVDSSNDVDDSFANGMFAFASMRGPYLVMTYDNAGWGINNMDAIAAHETGHIFGAADEYASSGCTCTSRYGYLYYENQNCANSCLINEPSIMKSNYPYVFANNLIDYYARGQVGWGDENSNDILDIIDFEPAVSCTYNGLEGNEFVISGNAGTDGLEAINPYYHTKKINRIASVEYSVNGGEWIAALAADGCFDSLHEEYGIRYTLTDPGDYSFRVRSMDRFGECTADANYYETSLSITDVHDIAVPQVVALSQNYPNPFNPSTTITYYLPEKSSVQLEIFDASGKRIAFLINEFQEKGQHVARWNGNDLHGHPAGSGIYFYRLKAGEEVISKKLALLR